LVGFVARWVPAQESSMQLMGLHQDRTAGCCLLVGMAHVLQQRRVAGKGHFGSPLWGQWDLCVCLQGSIAAAAPRCLMVLGKAAIFFP